MIKPLGNGSPLTGTCKRSAATCDVSDLIMDADTARRDGHDRFAFLLMSAARKVCDYQNRMAALKAHRRRINRPVRTSHRRRLKK